MEIRPSAVGMLRCVECGHARTKDAPCRMCNPIRGGKRPAPCSEEGCAYCERNTLASCERAKRRWATCNEKTPREIWRNSSERVRLVCDGCNRAYAQIASRVPLHDCALCVNKSERKLYDELIRHALEVVYQARFDWNPDGRYDFMVGRNVLVELDGPQHFKPVRTWRSGFEVCDQDKKKEDLALKHGMSVIRLLQDDVWHDTGDWRNYVAEHVFACALSDTPSVVTPPNRQEYTSGIYARYHSGDCFF